MFHKNMGRGFDYVDMFAIQCQEAGEDDWISTYHDTYENNALCASSKSCKWNGEEEKDALSHQLSLS